MGVIKYNTWFYPQRVQNLRRQDISSITIEISEVLFGPIRVTFGFYSAYNKNLRVLSRTVTIWFMFLNVTPAAMQRIDNKGEAERSREMIAMLGWWPLIGKMDWLAVHLRGRKGSACWWVRYDEVSKPGKSKTDPEFFLEQ